MNAGFRDVRPGRAVDVLGPAAALCDREALQSCLASRFPGEDAGRMARLAEEIAWNALQAACFFDCALSAPLFISPLLGYYGVLAVSRAVVLTIRGSAPLAEVHWGHGLTLKRACQAGGCLEGAVVIAKRKGAFPSLQACCGEPVTEGTRYRLADLVDMVLSASGRPAPAEASLHFLALFGLSMLVRYHAQAWGECSLGEDADRLRQAVHASVQRFPAAAAGLTGMIPGGLTGVSPP